MFELIVWLRWRKALHVSALADVEVKYKWEGKQVSNMADLPMTEKDISLVFEIPGHFIKKSLILSYWQK